VTGDLGVSADGRWLTGITQYVRGPSFEAFDARTGKDADWNKP
jgi:hypothetical protein